MVDPLGLIGARAGGLDPVHGAGRFPAGGPVPEPGAPSFKDLLLQNLSQVNQLQADATRAVEDLASGRRTDLETVLMATQKADTAFRMLQAVRNKVLEAYEEVKQMRA